MFFSQCVSTILETKYHYSFLENSGTEKTPIVRWLSHFIQTQTTLDLKNISICKFTIIFLGKRCFLTQILSALMLHARSFLFLRFQQPITKLSHLAIKKSNKGFGAFLLTYQDILRTINAINLHKSQISFADSLLTLKMLTQNKRTGPF